MSCTDYDPRRSHFFEDAFYVFDKLKRKDSDNMSEAISIPEIYGSRVFSDSVMCEKLPKKIYKELKRSIETGTELSPEIAEVVANAMKDWAIEKGATHYTHCLLYTSRCV